MEVLANLEPKNVMHWFEFVCSYPHGSLKEEKLAAAIMDFARSKGLECKEDAWHNVLVRKPASPGYEDKAPVLLQAHIDMIWAKEKGVDFDFETQGLNLYIDGDKVRARGTTLGADDGIGAAFMLAVLDDDTLEHPPIEAVFTTAEEIGMVGAIHFDKSQLTAKRMINFDAGGFTEGRIYVGCAGIMRAMIRQQAERVPFSPAGHQPVQIVVGGLKGGHPGGDVGKGRGNATQMMGRILRQLLAMEGVEVSHAESADFSQDNKYSMPIDARILACAKDVAAVTTAMASLQATLRDELSDVDEGVTITVTQTGEVPAQVLSRGTVETMTRIVALLPNGVQSMQRLFPDTPECSATACRVEWEGDTVIYYSSVRSCKDSLLTEMGVKYQTIAALNGCEVELGDPLPGWDYDKNSHIRQLVEAEYVREFGREPRFKVTHAGTECSQFKKDLPDLDIISMGPIIYEEHTPKEYLGIPSVGVLWTFLKNILRQL